MEKIMVLKAFSEKKQREFNRQDGTKAIIEWHDVILTDGIDTIMGETSENLTRQINATDENVRLEMKIGQLYNVRATFQVLSYKKDEKDSFFMKANISQMAIV